MKIFARPKLDIKILIIWALTAIVLVWFLSKHSALQQQFGELERKLNDAEISRVTSVYDRNKPLIFVGGVPRSGTTLMRAILDAHPLIRCGEETRILPIMVSMRYKWLNQNDYEKERLRDAGVTQEVIDSAVGAFLLEVMLQHGQQAPYLCNKDPLMLSHMTFLKSVFPKSQFIFMIRDGRATVHSIISRKIKISGFNLNSYRECFIQWNSIIENMLSECIQVGSDSCLMVYYEQLVLHPEANLRRIFDFLQIEWNDAVLHHEQFIGDQISLSKTEKSTDQVIKPVNSDALSSWIGNIPNDVLADMNSIAPMLKILGYDPNANPPNYSLLESSFLSIKK